MLKADEGLGVGHAANHVRQDEAASGTSIILGGGKSLRASLPSVLRPSRRAVDQARAYYLRRGVFK